MTIQKEALLPCLPSPKELDIPFDGWRDEQAEVLSRVLESDKKFIVVDMPTGGGKSGVAVGLHHLLSSRRTVITTSTIYLQQQYQDWFGMPSMKGRSNFACDLRPELSCDNGLCALQKGCDKQEKWTRCSYYRQKRVALSSPLVVLNLSYFLHEACFVGGFSKLDLLVLDEGHLVENALMGFIEKRISFKMLNRYSYGKARNIRNIAGMRNALYGIEDLVEDDMKASFSRSCETEDPQDMKETKKLVRLLETVRFVMSSDSDDWVLDKDLGAYVLSPVMVGKMASKYLFRHAERIILMSATILNGEIFGRQLGIEPEEMEYIATSSPFLLVQRPVVVRPVVKLSYRSPDKDYVAMAGEIDNILTSHSESSGIIHTVSFSLRDRLFDLLSADSKDRIISHGRNIWRDISREEAISALKTSEEPLVLMSPSAETGLDLRDDEARFAIWAKVPFGDLRNIQTQVRKTVDPAWYMWTVATKLVQGCGRIVRHSEDWGISYILDKQILWILRKERYLFPKWFLDSIVVHKASMVSTG